MAHIVIIGAGLGGMPMAYEMRELARKQEHLALIKARRQREDAEKGESAGAHRQPGELGAAYPGDRRQLAQVLAGVLASRLVDDLGLGLLGGQ